MELNYLNTQECERKPGKFDYQSALDFAAQHLAETFLAGGPQRQAHRDEVREFNAAQNKSETRLYARAKATLDSLLNFEGVQDFIPKSEWDDFRNLQGHSYDLWCHPHLHYAFYKQIEIMQKTKPADTLVVTPCTMTKPYSKVGRFKRIVNASQNTRAFDFMAFSVIPTIIAPFDASARYPLANYSWPIDVASEFLDYLKYLQSVSFFVEFIKVLKYKQIIFIHWNSLRHRIDLVKERWGVNNFIELFQIPVYREAHRFKFSTKELPEPKKFHNGCIATRIIEGTHTSCFMNDYFGPQMKPYFKQTWDDVSNEEKIYSGYSPELVESIMSQYRELKKGYEIWS